MLSHTRNSTIPCVRCAQTLVNNLLKGGEIFYQSDFLGNSWRGESVSQPEITGFVVSVDHVACGVGCTVVEACLTTHYYEEVGAVVGGGREGLNTGEVDASDIPLEYRWQRKSERGEGR